MIMILSFIFVLGVIVLVHEWGHFIAARLNGVRVEVFSIGFGPVIYRTRRGETEYRLSWIPLGGYVKMAGIIDEGMADESTITGAGWEFMSKAWWQKVMILGGGVFMNFFLAWMIYTGLITGNGETIVLEDAVIGSTSADMPAELAGLQVGDRIVNIDGQSVQTWEDLVAIIHARPAEPIDIEYERNGQPFFTSCTTMARRLPIDGTIRDVGMIGIGPSTRQESVSLWRGVVLGGDRLFGLLHLTFSQIGMFVSGEAGLKDLGGPILIARLTGEAARSGFQSLLAFLAFISVQIGFLNILPIPALDGGHIVIVTIESLMRRPIPVAVRYRIQQVGLVILLLLLIVVMRNDIQRIWAG